MINQQGKTAKQIAVHNFYAALDAYRAALKTKDSRAIVLASIRIHIVKGEVSKRLWPLVNRAYRGEI